MSGMYIHSASAFIGEANGDLAFLKEEIRRYTQENFRRGNRFILLSLLGARQCIQQGSLDVDTSVYLTTEHGNLGETAAVLDEIYTGHSLPKPFGFILPRIWASGAATSSFPASTLASNGGWSS
jgi:hypothetical protein